MLPKSVKSVLWSYDTSKIDLDLHKKLIVSSVLNFGNYKATNWLFYKYGKKQVAKIAKRIPVLQWNVKSLNYWSLLLGINPRPKPEIVN
ncbi:hypothetical protein HYV64_04305 [Candidatus Shapirobacteria bacterium]|nr:hypothetical protein [Candidatus Shapirobacteria bacterium]